MKKLTRRMQKVNAETIGLDVHKQRTVFSRLDRRGNEIAAGSFESAEEDLLLFLREHVGRRRTHVALEACGGMLWIYDVLVERLGQERVHVAQSRRIRAIANSQEKNDTNDAWWLAYLTHEGRLPECFVPTGHLRELRIATRERQALVATRSRWIVQLRSHLRQAGVRLPRRVLRCESNWQYLRETAAERGGSVGHAIESTLDLIDCLDETIVGWEDRIEALCHSMPEVALLRDQLPGVGPILAAVIAAEAGPVNRFRNAKAFGKYTGLTPTDRSSGGRTRHGAISRQGSPHLRRALTQAATICCRSKKG